MNLLKELIHQLFHFHILLHLFHYHYNYHYQIDDFFGVDYILLQYHLHLLQMLMYDYYLKLKYFFQPNLNLVSCIIIKIAHYLNWYRTSLTKNKFRCIRIPTTSNSKIEMIFNLILLILFIISITLLILV